MKNFTSILGFHRTSSHHNTVFYSIMVVSQNYQSSRYFFTRLWWFHITTSHHNTFLLDYGSFTELPVTTIFFYSIMVVKVHNCVPRCNLLQTASIGPNYRFYQILRFFEQDGSRVLKVHELVPRCSTIFIKNCKAI